MLRKIKELIGIDLVSKGDKIGTIADLLFDDQEWIIRYLVVDTDDWLSDRKTIILPQWLVEPDFENQVSAVKLTRRQIENCPPIEKAAPISRS